jgi:hypothetical protein
VCRCLGDKICTDRSASAACVVAKRAGQPFHRGIAIWHVLSGKKLLHSHGGHEELPIHTAYWQRLVQFPDLLVLGRWMFFVTFVCFTHYKLCGEEKKRLHTFVLTFLHCKPGWSWTGKVTLGEQFVFLTHKMFFQPRQGTVILFRSAWLQHYTMPIRGEGRQLGCALYLRK